MLVIVPFYNCRDWIDRSLATLNAQKATSEFRTVVMDDASTDGSGETAEKLCAEYGFTYQRNDENMKCPYTIWRAMQDHSQDPQEPVFILDGDDYLPEFPVINYVEEVYQDPDVWLTYGSYRPDPTDHPCSPAAMYHPHTIEGRNYRTTGAYFNHPLTWRTGLFNLIPEADFKNNDGQWFRAGYDRLFMYPMLEMATQYNGTCHWKLLEPTLYIYNGSNPISDVHAHLPECMEVDQMYRRPRKEPIDAIS